MTTQQNLKNYFSALVLLPGFLLLTGIGCGKKDIDKIGEAQACLDTATASTASACAQKVEGLETNQAYLIRCAASFITEGFDQPTRLNAAYQNMTNSSGGGSGATASLQVMSVLAFTSGGNSTANLSLSNTNLSHCNKSGSKGLILLSGVANMATTLLSLASCGTDLNCALNAAQNSATTQAAVGAAAAAAYTANCTSGQNSNQQFCSQFQAAVTSAGGTGNSQAVGAALITQYCTNTHCP